MVILSIEVLFSDGSPCTGSNMSRIGLPGRTFLISMPHLLTPQLNNTQQVKNNYEKFMTNSLFEQRAWYNFTDKDGAQVTLRPEMTPSLARMAPYVGA